MSKHFRNTPLFLRVCIVSLLKTLSREKEKKMLETSNFYLSPKCFLPFLENFLTFSEKSKIVVYKLFRLGRV